MITGIDLSQTQDFVSKFDKKESKTTWKIGVLPSPILSYCMGKAQSENQSLDAMIEMARFGLKGFENFQDKTGVHISFSTVNRPLNGRNYQVVADKIIDIIPLPILSELGAEILKLSNLTDDEVKN